MANTSPEAAVLVINVTVPELSVAVGSTKVTAASSLFISVVAVIILGQSITGGSLSTEKK